MKKLYIAVSVFMLLNLIFSGVVMTAAKNKNAGIAKGFSYASASISIFFMMMFGYGALVAFLMMSGSKEESKEGGGAAIASSIMIFALYVTAIGKSLEAVNRAKEGKFDEAADAATVSFGVQLAAMILGVLAMFGVGVYQKRQSKK